MKLEQLRNEWQDKISQYEASGKKQSVWCRENGIDARKLSRWYNKFKNQDSSTPTIQSWVPVTIGEAPQISSINLKIGKVSIEVKEGFQASLLIKIARVLGDIC